MAVITHDTSVPITQAAPTVALKRRTIDSVLIGVGAVVAVVMFVAGGLLMWGSNFAQDYVHDELSSQKIVFPPAADLQAEGRSDLVQYAGQTVDTGQEAQAYAGYIAGHLEKIGGGKTYAELGPNAMAATAAVADAKANGAPASEIAALQAKADPLNAQRDTMFKGETLRGLLLSAFAWSTVGRIAGIAAWVALLAGAVMLVLVLFGWRHHHKVVVAAS